MAQQFLIHKVTDTMNTKTTYTPYLANEKIRIAFLFQIPSFWPSWESFYNACLNDSRFEVKLLWLNERTIRTSQMETAELFLHDNVSYESFNELNLALFRPHVIVLQSPYDFMHRANIAYSMRLKQLGARIVYITYGIEVSDTKEMRTTHFLPFTMLNAWRIYTFSNKMRADYVKHCPNRAAVRAFGHPRFDGYANRTKLALPENILKNAAGRKIILWNMHFPKMNNQKTLLVTPNPKEYIKFAKKISAFDNLFFVFSPHPLLAAGIDTRQNPLLAAGMDALQTDETTRADILELMVILRSIENVFFSVTNDYRNVLINADAIILDLSSLLVDVGIVGVPVFYMQNSEYTEKPTDAVAPLFASYYQGTTADEMICFLEMFDSGLDPKKELRDSAFRECMPYTDGRCGIRIANDIANSIIDEKPRLVPKIAIFAIGEVFHYYWETTDILQNGKIEIVVLSDNNTALHGTRFCNLPVVDPLTLREFDFDAIVIFSEIFYRELFKQLAFEINIDCEKIMRLDSFLLWLSTFEGV